MTDNSDFAKEFLATYNDPKTKKKSLGKAIGLPDKQDEEFLLRLIKNYEKENPGWLEFHRNNARKMLEAGKGIGDQGAVVNAETYMTHDFELPPSFYKKIESHYPLMFKDVTHYRWFKRTFAALLIDAKGDKRIRPA